MSFPHLPSPDLRLCEIFLLTDVPLSCSEFSSTDLKSVGNYTLGRLIGKGSFGKVYLASHKLTNGSKVSACFRWRLYRVELRLTALFA